MRYLDLRQYSCKDINIKKAGVIITEITEGAQLGLFDSVDREKHNKLMQIVDKINGDHGQRIKLAVQGNGREWRLKQEQLSDTIQPI